MRDVTSVTYARLVAEKENPFSSRFCTSVLGERSRQNPSPVMPALTGPFFHRTRQRLQRHAPHGRRLFRIVTAGDVPCWLARLYDFSLSTGYKYIQKCG
jgi:hypothetical protein